MDTDKIVALIKKRRDYFFDLQVAGTGDDLLEYSAASLNRVIADEYDSLLEEIARKDPRPLH